MGTIIARAGIVVITTCLLAGCAAGPSGPTANVDPIDAAVLVAVGDGEPRGIEERHAAAEGDIVSTDDGGLAEVLFPDGSFMRVGPASEVTITELGAADVQRTSIALDIGETWHNVQDLVAEDAVYEVVTPVGVASVKGTVFGVVCVEGPSCEFIVLDGEVDVDGVTVSPYQRLVLPGDAEALTVPLEAMPPWVAPHVERDDGHEDAQTLPDAPVEAASLAGEWLVHFTVTESNGEIPKLGEESEYTWTFGETVCDAICTVSISSETGWTVDAQVDDGLITFTRSATEHCVFEDGTESSDTYTWTRTYAIAMSEASEGRVTSMTMEHTGVSTLDAGFTECDMQTFDGSKTIRFSEPAVLTRP